MDPFAINDDFGLFSCRIIMLHKLTKCCRRFYPFTRLAWPIGLILCIAGRLCPSLPFSPPQLTGH